jgi:hypothetical protein
MKNIHVSISDLAYFRARVWAAERETSISAIVAYLLETLPQIKRANAHNPVAVSAKSRFKMSGMRPVCSVNNPPGLYHLPPHPPPLPPIPYK